MAKAVSTNDLKKELAKTLFFSDKNITRKEIAARVGATEKTVGNWVRDGEWEVLRTSLLTSKKDQISRLYNILRGVTDAIEEMEGIGNTKLADMMIKYTAAIRNLETDTSTAEIVEVCRMALAFTQRNYPEHLKNITDVLDALVQEKLK
jgi:predicted transcriptional regulator